MLLVLLKNRHQIILTRGNYNALAKSKSKNKRTNHLPLSKN